jgi:hypothetical protein
MAPVQALHEAPKKAALQWSFPSITRFEMFAAFFTPAEIPLKLFSQRTDMQRNAPGEPGTWSG